MKKSTTFFIPAAILLLGYALGLVTSLVTETNIYGYAVLNLFGLIGGVLFCLSEKARKEEQTEKMKRFIIIIADMNN